MIPGRPEEMNVEAGRGGGQKRGIKEGEGGAGGKTRRGWGQGEDI